MVGLVIVSHSAGLAEGVAELAKGMGGEDVPVEVAGGVPAAGGTLGTDAALVAEAIERAYSDEGVLVLMDLGSALLSAEMALELLPPERRERVVLSDAPLVEGAVAAVVAARVGKPLGEVAADARGGLEPKAAQLGADAAAPAAAAGPGEVAVDDERTLRIVVWNRLGLHARPAARFVQAVGGFDADVRVTNLTTGRGPTSGRSLNALATLGVRRGHEILVSALGTGAEEALTALQALAERNFDEDEAEAATASAARAPATPAAVTPAPHGALAGLAVSPGIAIGPARRLRGGAPAILARVPEDPEAEWRALQDALEAVRLEIEETRRSVASRAGDYHAAIFDAHLLFLDDEALLGPTRRAVFEEGWSAAEAWDAAAERVAADYRALEDEYLKARAADVEAVAGRVLAHLAGVARAAPYLQRPGILVAPDLSPADTAALARDLVHGIATAYGAPTSHSAILARSLGLPAVVGLGEAVLALEEGTELLLDGDAGVVYVRPEAATVAEYRAELEARDRAARAAREAAHEPAVTRDGHRVEVAANVGSPHDLPAALASGAEAVGLLRTEFLFLDRDSVPTEEEQYDAYREIGAALEGRPCVVRTLDVGGDKPLPYLPQPPEANPFLGVRGLRLALAHPELLAAQARAVLRASAEYRLELMFPMVTTLEEFRAARSLVEEARATLAAAGVPVPEDLGVGVMVEVPAIALAARAFAPEVDFFSVGTNDLAQYTMAAERGNEHVAALADALHPAVLRLVREVVVAAEANRKWVGVCGEVAGDPVAVPLLVGLGVAELSMSPPAIPAAKEVVRRLDFGAARDLAESALSLASASSVRELVARELGDVFAPRLAAV